MEKKDLKAQLEEAKRTETILKFRCTMAYLLLYIANNLRIFGFVDRETLYRYRRLKLRLDTLLGECQQSKDYIELELKQNDPNVPPEMREFYEELANLPKIDFHEIEKIVMKEIEYQENRKNERR